MGQALVAPWFQSGLSSEFPLDPKCLQSPYCVFLGCPRPHRLRFLSMLFFLAPNFLSPSGIRLIIEARNEFNLGHLPAQSVNYFCSFTLTKPSSLADLSCLAFWQHFSLLKFLCDLLFHFPSLLFLFSYHFYRQPSTCVGSPSCFLLPPRLYFWRCFSASSWVMDFGDPPTCSSLGDLHHSESTNKDYISRGRCLLHRTLFHFPRIPGVGSGFDGASNGESQSSVLLQIGQLRTLNVPCPSPRPSCGRYLKEDVSILTAGCKSGQFFFWKAPWFCVQIFNTFLGLQKY